MKRIFLCAALCAAVITSCEKKEITPEIAENQVSFVIDGPMTRVATTGNVSTFEKGDKISITSKGLYEDITNEEYTVGAENLTGKAVYFGKEDASFVAHYPAGILNDNGNITMTVAADQDSDEDFHKNMFMVATAAGNKTKASVSLAFVHQLAMVKVNIEGLDNATSVTFSNIVPELTWSATALVTSTTAEAIDIAAWKQEGKQEYWVLVPAQKVAAEAKLITITDAEGKKYEYVLGNDITFTTGKVKTVNLTFKGNLVNAEFPVLDNVNWEDDETAMEDYFDVVPPTPVSGIVLDKAEAELYIDQTLTLTATVTPDEATDKTVVWTSSKETVATVADGVVTAKAIGTAVITATAGEFSATCTVTVTEQVVSVESVVLDQATATVKVGKTLTLTATVTPDNATDKTVVWTSDNEEVATVDGGVVTALKAGEAVITATAGEKSATCTVTVEGLIELISADAGDFTKVTTLNPNKTSRTDMIPGWGTWIANQSAEASISNGELVLKITGSSTNWYDKDVLYKVGSAVQEGTYELKFTARISEKSETADNNKLYLNITPAGSYSGNQFIQIGNAYRAFPECTTEEKEFKYDVVISKTVSSANNVTTANISDDKKVQADLSAGVILMISSNKSAGQTFYIKDVTLIEKVTE